MVQLRLLFILSFILLAGVSGADIYRYVDGDGGIHFFNTQPNGKFELYLREGPKAPPPAQAAALPGASWMTGYVDRFSRANDLPPALVHAIIKAESNGPRKAVSPKGARGVRQVMAVTPNGVQGAATF